MLYPNCSEVCWRLDYGSSLDTKEQIVNALMEVKQYSEEHQTSGTDSGTVETFVWLLEEAKKKGINIFKIDLDITDQSGGNENFVWDMFDLAKQVVNKDITLTIALEKEQNWGNGDEE